MFEQRLWFKRFEQEIAGAGAHRFDRPIDISIGRHQYHREMRITAANLLEQGDSVHRHHAHVAHDQCDGLRIQQSERLFATGSRHHRLTGKFERVAHRFAQVWVVFDNQNGESLSHFLPVTLSCDRLSIRLPPEGGG